MTVYVFTGPTLAAEEVRAELEAIVLPPVAQGDVYRATLTRPQAIGIIDGYFERMPAVWHKEILWAMREGVHVFGSASMGALRAAELAPFGMEGVGAIFESFRDGALTDDDEVAVAHGPAESGYRALSEAMVNVRGTLAAAKAAGVIGAGTSAALERIAKSLFYPERAYPSVLRCAAEQGLPAGELRAFRAWLPDGRVDQKRQDALAMLRLMRERLAVGLQPKRVSFFFEYTSAWDAARQSIAELPPSSDTGEGTFSLDAVLDELRLEGDALARARQATRARLSAIQESRRRGMVVDSETFQETAVAFRRERGLLTPDDLDRWLVEHGLTHEQFLRLMEDEARVRWIDTGYDMEVTSRISDHLRVVDEYPRLLSRARDKQRLLETRGLDNPRLANVGLTEDDLLCWYFMERLGLDAVPNVAQHVRDLSFANEGAFRRAVLREFCYVTADRRG